MLRDYEIARPRGAGTYELHQFVETIAEGHETLLWRAEPDCLRVRTNVVFDAPSVPLEPVEVGLFTFHLVAAVRYKAGNATRYYPSSQRQPRVEWLEREAHRHGFELVDVHVSARKDEIKKPDRSFALDETTFIGVLRVANGDSFNRMMQSGIGSVGRAFGRGLMTVRRIA